MNKKVSVIMAVFNAEKTLKTSIDSILNQTYQNFEFIICDDASTDNSYDILKEYAKKDDRIILIQNEKNSRLAYSLNHCLKYATGEYVARMDADDISKEERFEKQVEFLEKHSDVDMVGTFMQRFTDEGGLADVMKTIEAPVKHDMRNHNPFFHATIMMRKSAYDALGGYIVCKRTVRGQDYDMWFRFFALGLKGYNMSEPLYLVREDINAIKRRTIKVRFYSYQTIIKGFKLLKFPWYWCIKPTIDFLFKSIVPYGIILKYREYQKKKYNLKKGNIK